MYFTSRKSFYTSKALLKNFQKTITCPFYDSNRVSYILQHQLKGRSINILDIGGGEGMFTSLLLKHLKSFGVVINDLVCVDPINWSKDYINLTSQYIDQSKIKFIQNRIQEFKWENKFDLILASHSLYAIVDELKMNNYSEVQYFIRNILNLKKKGGIITCILTSGKSKSYKFKNQALEYIFKEKIIDTNSEIFQSILSMTKINYITYESNNFIILTDLLKQLKEGNKKYLEMWFSYFLRFNIQKLTTSEFNHVLNLLVKNSRNLKVRKSSTLKMINFKYGYSDNEKVLSHKTNIIVY